MESKKGGRFYLADFSIIGKNSFYTYKIELEVNSLLRTN
jgi:hypothetical protein